jgi:hypothetical protein
MMARVPAVPGSHMSTSCSPVMLKPARATSGGGPASLTPGRR